MAEITPITLSLSWEDAYWIMCILCNALQKHQKDEKVWERLMRIYDKVDDAMSESLK